MSISYLDNFIKSSRILYFLNILISECNNKSLYCMGKSLMFKSALIKVCTCFMFTSSYNLIKYSSLKIYFHLL